MSILYAEDRVASDRPTATKPDEVKARALGIIRAAVPRGGAPKTTDELVKLVRSDSQCYVLFAEDIAPLVDAVRAERPKISQVAFADEAVEEKPIDVGDAGSLGEGEEVP